MRIEPSHEDRIHVAPRTWLTANRNPMGETAYGWIPDHGLRFQDSNTVVDL